MAADPSVVINLAAEYTGKKAFSQADTATQRLNKSVSSLAKSVIAAFSVTAVTAFAKASIRAAAQDQKAQQQLALALKNVGLGRDAATAEGYIQRLQSEFGIVDDKLRPAYQQLAVATRDTGETQRLLGIALDVSAANSLELGTVSKALSKAYLGNNTALGKLGVGISKADLKTKSFKEITDLLSATFAGSAKTAASGYQGSLDKLAVAANNVKEIIGVGLLDALAIVSGDQGIGNATTAAENYAQKISDAAVGTAYLIEELKKIPGASIIFKILSDPLGIDSLLNAAQAFKRQARPFKTPMTISGQVEIKTAKAKTKFTKEQAAAQSKILADKKLTLAIDKANLALGKGGNIFDMDAIQLNAALIGQAEALGKATSGAQILAIANDIQRLKVKQDISALEDAIASKDTAAIEKATAKLNEDMKILGALQKQDAKLLDINKVLAGMKSTDLINLANLQAALDLLAKFKFPTLTLPSILMPGGTTSLNPNAGITFNPNQNKDRNYDNNVLDIASGMASSQSMAGITFNPNQNKDRNYTNNVINISAGVVGSENIIVDAVQNALNEIARRGNLTTYAGAISA